MVHQIWQSQEGIDKIDNCIDHSNLQLSGIVVNKNSKLKIYNQIYYNIFNNKWIEKTLANLPLYLESLRQWILSNKQDNSRLLRGNALLEAENWANGKSLSKEELEFLKASRTLKEEEQLADEKKQTELESGRIGGMIIMVLGVLGLVSGLWRQVLWAIFVVLGFVFVVVFVSGLSDSKDGN